MTAPARHERREDWYARMHELYERSPVHRALGMRLGEIGPGRAEVVFEPAPEAINLHGVVHGGTLATVADSALLQCVRTLTHETDRLVTLELKINYLAPARGARFTCVGEAVRVGRGSAVSTARLLDGDRRPVAISLGTIHITRGAGGP
jgi:uncharacterized protein (TIGR00369 family)